MTGEKAIRHKFTSHFSWTGAASTVALLISVATFYLTYFQENHELKLILVDVQPDVEPPFRWQVHGVLINGGNRTETLLRTQLLLRAPSGGVMANLKPNGPFVVKPGEAIPISLSMTLSDAGTKEAFTWTGPDSDQLGVANGELSSVSVDMSGRTCDKQSFIGKIEISDSGGNVEIKKAGEEQAVDLLCGRH